MPGPKEGRAGGIPMPGSEASLAVAGDAGDGGGLLVGVIVTDDTPICRALKAAGANPEGNPMLEAITRDAAFWDPFESQPGAQECDCSAMLGLTKP